MAACETCGQKAGIGKKLCEACQTRAAEQRSKEREAERARLAQEQKEQREAEAERKKQAEIDRQKRYEAFMQGRLDELASLLAQGVTPYLYTVLFINAQSNMSGQKVGSLPDLREMQQYGWIGWEAIGTVPSTYGEGLQNEQVGTFGKHWGGGIGGLVVGAYVLMRFGITRQVLDVQRDYIISLIAEEFTG